MWVAQAIFLVYLSTGCLFRILQTRLRCCECGGTLCSSYLADGPKSGGHSHSKLTKAGGRKPTHGCNYPMVGWPSVILTPMGPSLNLTREGTSRPSLRSSLSLSLADMFGAMVF